MTLLKQYWPQVAVSIVIAVLVVAVAIQTLRLHAAWNETAKLENVFKQYRVDQQAEIVRVAAQHQEELKNVSIQARQETEQKIEDERNAYTVALNDTNKLHNRNIARLRASCNSTTASRGNDASDPIGVLAHVLTRSDTGAGIYARVADERGVALKACIASYEALRGD